MALDMMTWPIKAEQREVKLLTVSFVGAGTSQPTNVQGPPGATVSRTGTGQYTVSLGGAGSAKILGVSVSINQGASSNLYHTVQWDEDLLVGVGIAVKDALADDGGEPPEPTPFAYANLDGEKVLVAMLVQVA